jgi:hypothetical protein
MRTILRTRNLRFAPALVTSLTLILLAAGLDAQTSQWQAFGTSAEGFHAMFPSQPEVSKSSIPVGSETFELRSYVAEVGPTALFVAVCDYGANGAAGDPQEMLTSAKNGAVDHMKGHILSERKITLDSNPGVEFEAESDTLHFTARIYMVDGVLYQTMVAKPLDEKFADTARFLDSFQLLPRPHTQPVQAIAPDWKPFVYASDGFSVFFPSQPKAEKQNVSNVAGTFELRTYVAEDSTTSLIAAVCDYGPIAAGKDPAAVLDDAKKGAINNIKGQLVSEKKITLGANPGVEFEADSDSAHVSARIYLVGSVLYQTIIASPLNVKYADVGRFLDSFKLVDRTGK